MPIITCIWVVVRLNDILVDKIISSTLEMGSQEIYIKIENAYKSQDYLSIRMVFQPIHEEHGPSLTHLYSGYL